MNGIGEQFVPVPAMSEPTDADREQAAQTVAAWTTDSAPWPVLTDRIARDRAVAREEGERIGEQRVRAAVEALADALADDSNDAGLLIARRYAADRLRAAVAPAQPADREPRRLCICNRVAEGAAFHTPACEAQPVTCTRTDRGADVSTVYADKEEYMRLLETERRHTALLQDLEALPAVGTLRDAPVVALADLRAVIEAAQAPR